MGRIYKMIKARQERLHTVTVDARVKSAAIHSKPDTARRMSIFMQDLDRVRAARHLESVERHSTMQRLANEAKALGLKGRWNLLCNRTQCLNTPATFYNRGSYAFYCSNCARDLNRVNARDAEELLGEGMPLCVNIGTAEEATKLHVMP